MSDTDKTAEKEYGLKSDLAKMLLVIVHEIGAREPQAFKEIDIIKALKQADIVGRASACPD